MVQWFKRLRIYLLRLLGAQPLSIDLTLDDTERKLTRAAITVHRYYRDEGIQAVVTVLKAEQTRALYSLASFSGGLEQLNRLQGRLDAVSGLLTFLKDADELKDADLRRLVSTFKEEPKSVKVLNLTPSSRRQDTVI